MLLASRVLFGDRGLNFLRPMYTIGGDLDDEKICTKTVCLHYTL
jgi:hypothetical protein